MSVDLDKISAKVQKAFKQISKRIIICAGTGCVANGSLKVYAEFLRLATCFKKRLSGLLSNGTFSFRYKR